MKLSLPQQVALEKIATLKENYDRQIEALEAEVARRKDELKNDIRDAVAYARDIGVPVRQIHQKGLGFQQVGSMLNFLEARDESLSAQLDRITRKVVPQQTITADHISAGSVVYREPARTKITEVKENEWHVIDTDGDEWTLYWIVDHGVRVPADDSPFTVMPPESVEAVRNHRPTTFTSWDEYQEWLNKGEG